MEEQRWLAACARDGRRVHGGAAALRRRRPRIRVGRGSVSRNRPRGSSPRTFFARRRAGGRSSAERGELRDERRWRPALWSPIRPGSDPNRARGGSWFFGVRLGSSGAKGSRRDGEERPARRALLALLGSSCTEEGERSIGTGREASWRPREEKSGVGARLPTRGRARRRPQRRYGRRAHSIEQEEHCLLV